MKTVTIKCENCGGPLEFISGQTSIVCSFCGSQNLITQSPSDSIKKAFEIRMERKDDLERLETTYNDALQRGDHDQFLEYYRQYLTLSLQGTPGFEDEAFLNRYVEDQLQRYKRGFAGSGKTPTNLPARRSPLKWIIMAVSFLLFGSSGAAWYFFRYASSGSFDFGRFDMENIVWVVVSVAAVGFGFLMRFLRRRI